MPEKILGMSRIIISNGRVTLPKEVREKLSEKWRLLIVFIN
jgi:bifunctional DNA-binding transcriptional regulator/antitoxin component of YhaV-PrlF toxin-antitoxin module